MHMKLSPKHIGITITMLFLCCALNAQQFVNVWLNGAQTVCSIIQDKQGILWLGCDDGLYSFDGYHSYSYYTNGSINNARINAITIKGENLYLATANGLQAFNTNTYSYQSFPSQKLYNTNNNETKSELRVVDQQNVEAIYGSDVYALLHTNKGLLVGTINGLFLVNNNHKTNVYFTEGKQPLVNALAYDAKRKCYWIGTEGALYRSDLQLKTFNKIKALDGNSIKCFAQNNNGSLYIGTDNGLYCMAIDNTINHYIHDSHDTSTIPNNIVWACYIDQWQNVWIGTDNGLSRMVTNHYYEYTPIEKVASSTEGNCLHEIYQSRNGEWWLGGTNGLIRQGKAWYKQNSEKYSLSHNRVRKIYEDIDGDVWVCTDHGINMFDRRTQQMHNFIVYDKTGKYSTTWAYDILEDKQGRMWMASYMGGIFVVDKQRLVASLKISKIPATPITSDFHLTDKGKNALSGLHIGQLVMDGQGMIWASSYNHLDRINTQSLKIDSINNNDVVNYLMSDTKGNVWVAGNSSVKCYSVKSAANKLLIDKKQWEIGAKAVCMCDVEGQIWVISGTDCCVIGAGDRSYRFKLSTSIMPLTMFYSKLEQKVVIGGNDGFLSVNTKALMKADRKKKLLLCGVMINGKPLQRLGALQRIKKMALRYDENNIVLQLTDLPFDHLPSMVYAYKLEGIDHDWQYLNKNNLDITYNGLPHGRYRLAVHSVDGEGHIGCKVYGVDILISPPWYLCTWAKIVYALFLIFLLIGVMKFVWVRKRLFEERQQKAAILQQVDARMNFFTRLADDLRAAVDRRSFSDILTLTNSYLGIKADEPVAEKAEPMLSPADQRLLKEINEVIERSMINSDFNVTTLQEQLGMGGKQLYRKMKALTGKTPVEYIRAMRMSKASAMLKEGRFSVAEVMYTVGFTNSGYFSKCFSKAFGMTPTEYMKQ